MAHGNKEFLQKYSTTGLPPHEIRMLHGKNNKNFAVLRKTFPSIEINIEKDGFIINSVGSAHDDDIKNAKFVASIFSVMQKAYTAKNKALNETDIITISEKVIEGDKKFIDNLIGTKTVKAHATKATFETVAKPRTDKLPRITKKKDTAKPRSQLKTDNKENAKMKNAFTFKNQRLANKILDPEIVQKIETAFGVKIESSRNAVIEKEGTNITIQALVSGGLSSQRDQALHVLRDIQKEYVLKESDAFTDIIRNVETHSKKEDFDLTQAELDSIDLIFDSIDNHLKPLRSNGIKSFKTEVEQARHQFKIEGEYKQLTAVEGKKIFSDLFLKYDEVVAETKPHIVGTEIKAAVLKISDLISIFNDEQTKEHLAAKEHFSNNERSEYGSMIGTTLKEKNITLDESARKILINHTYKAVDDVFVGTASINEIVDHYTNNKLGNKMGAGVDAHFSNVLISTKLQTVRPKNSHQEEFIRHLQDPEKLLVVGLGAAGTGKTFLSIANAAAQFSHLKKLVLTRPVVEAGENLGFMPGSMNEKLDPYMRPYYDGLEETLCSAKELEKLIEVKKAEVAPLAFMRGRTFKGTQHQRVLLMLDEAQNATYGQLKLFLTRVGEYCDVVVTGDITQTDLPSTQRNGMPLALNNRPGLPYLVRMLEMQKDNSVAITKFPDESVERSQLAKMAVMGFAALEEILLKEEEEEKENQRVRHLVGNSQPTHKMH